MLSVFMYLISSFLCMITGRNIKNSEFEIRDCLHIRFQTFELDYLGDIMVLFQLIYTLFILENMEELYEFCTVMSIVQCLKMICTSSTVLPPLKNYSDKIRLWGINGSGTEYIFSGHASYSAVCFMILLRRNYSLPFLIFYNFCSQFFIIISKNHYTVDVLLGWIISCSVWLNFILYEKNQKCLSQ